MTLTKYHMRHFPQQIAVYDILSNGTVNMDDMTFFHAGTMRICSSLDIGDALKNCFYFFKAYFPVELLELTVIDEEIDSARILARYSEFKVKFPLNKPIPMSKKAWAFANAEFHIGNVVFLDSSDSTQPSRGMADLLGMEELSGMGLLLGIKGKLLGMAAILSRSLHQFNQEHARLLRLLHDPFAIALSNHLHYRKVIRLQEMLADDNRYLHRELHRLSGDKIVGAEHGLAQVMKKVAQVAPLSNNVLLVGDTGVGKEVVANAIHYSSSRRTGPLIKLNCGGIPEGLIDSELFGHEKGAFTGAQKLRRGRFERAHGGTLFLDEVGELPKGAQIRLLRVLQEKKIERVGGTRPIEVDVRIIAATHRNLKEMVQQGKFREDLFYRLNVFPITIPPLRQRKRDIPAFVEHFINSKIKELNLSHQPVISAQALQRLQTYHWPGNVRELENAVERELIRRHAGSKAEPLCFDDIMTSNIDFPVQTPFPTQTDSRTELSLDLMVQAHIRKVLELTRGKIQGKDGAAALLGINPSTLRHRMRKLKIAFGRKNTTTVKNDE